MERSSRARPSSVVPAALAAAPAAAAPAAAASTITYERGGAEVDLSRLSWEELERTLQQRRLIRAGEAGNSSSSGSSSSQRQEMEQRLADFLANPSSFPQADCRPAEAVLMGGRLFGSQLLLRQHVQRLLSGLPTGEAIEPGHPDYTFLLAILQRHPRYAEKVGCVWVAGGLGGWDPRLAQEHVMGHAEVESRPN